MDRDGWLDIAIGCDNIGDAMGGLPYSRLYVFKPNWSKFEDIGGTDLVPDFGGDSALLRNYFQPLGVLWAVRERFLEEYTE